MIDHVTVYQAELEAIYQACKYMDKQCNIIQPEYVKLLTDSQPALQALNSIILIQVLHLKQLILYKIQLGKQKMYYNKGNRGTITQQVKALIGTEGNKAADKAARKGPENRNNTIKVIHMPIPAAHAKTIIHEAIRKE